MKFLTLLESIFNKQYLSLESIVQNKDLALSLVKKGNKIDIICYDTSIIFDDFKGFIFKIDKKEKMDSILFCGQIQYKNNAPLDAASVNFAISHPKVSGINILYPILGLIAKIYFNDGIIYSDHITGYIPSEDAQKVWNKFFSDQHWQIQKIQPVDDKKQKITPSLLDDGKVHYKIDDPIISYFKNKRGIYYLLNKLKKQNDNNLISEINEIINEINDVCQENIKLNIENIDETISELQLKENEILKKILEKFRSPVDWVFKLKDTSEMNTSSIQLLMKRNEEYIRKSNWIKSKEDFTTGLKNLSDKYYIFSKQYRK